MKLTEFENKSNDELKELLEILSRKADSDEVRLICWIIKKHLDGSI